MWLYAHTIQHKPVRNAQRQNEQDIRKKAYSGNNNDRMAPTDIFRAPNFVPLYSYSD